MFFRSIIDELKSWKKQTKRKPLILRGARQVGKTTAVNLFSKEFKNYIYLNLEKKDDRSIFERNLSVKDTLDYILLTKNVLLKKGETLIFIDEIQNSHKAVSLLRYFYESLPELFIIAAGSLLEMMMEENAISFPVGRVEFRFMYPLTFEEFIIAMNNKSLLKYYNQMPVKDFAVIEIKKLFHTYTMIGGMPEIVEKYIETKNVSDLKIIYQSLITSYIDDVKKYARNGSMAEIIKHSIESAPMEVGKRIKFQGFGNSNYKSREIGEALKNLQRAMLLYIVYPVTSEKPPALVDKKKSPRLQFIDTGLLNYSLGLHSHFFKNEDLQAIYKGKLAEHIIGQELIANDSLTSNDFLFWVKEKKQSNAEIDFLLMYNGYYIPIEVKSGRSGTLRSLHEFMDRVNHNFAVRMYNGDLSIENTKTTRGKEYKLLNLPLCFIGRIEKYIQEFMT